MVKNSLCNVFKIFGFALRSRSCIFSISTLLVVFSTIPQAATAGHANQAGEHWIGTWATAPQPALPGEIDTFQNQTLRLIVHTSAGGKESQSKNLEYLR